MSTEKMRALVCEECGQTVMIPASRTVQKVCRDCNMIRNNRRTKERDARIKAERAKKAPELFTCPACGEVAERKTPNKKYCTDCAAKRQKMTVTQRQQMDLLLGVTKLKRPTTSEALATFDPKGKSIERLNAEARAFGMTYGQYVAAVACGSIVHVVESKGIKDWQAVLRSIYIK